MAKLVVCQVGSFALSEANSGSDAFALETSAKKDGDHWVLNGEKLWITNSAESGIWLVFANILPSDSKEPVNVFSFSYKFEAGILHVLFLDIDILCDIQLHTLIYVTTIYFILRLKSIM